MVAVVTTGLQRRRFGGDMGNFKEELRARFGPTDCEDFDEALSKIKQTGTLREYQKEFERLGNQ